MVGEHTAEQAHADSRQGVLGFFSLVAAYRNQGRGQRAEDRGQRTEDRDRPPGQPTALAMLCRHADK